MAVETERKFKVLNDDWRQGVSGQYLKQAYLSLDPERTIRVRIAGTEAWLTVKGPVQGHSRLEFEYKIPVSDGEAMLSSLCQSKPIEKIRYRIPFQGHIFEVDEFKGENLGLVITEIELKNEGEHFACPHWMGEEVTADRRYYNSYLAQNPFSLWEDQDQTVQETTKN